MNIVETLQINDASKRYSNNFINFKALYYKSPNIQKMFQSSPQYDSFVKDNVIKNLIDKQNIIVDRLPFIEKISNLYNSKKSVANLSIWDKTKNFCSAVYNSIKTPMVYSFVACSSVCSDNNGISAGGFKLPSQIIEPENGKYNEKFFSIFDNMKNFGRLSFSDSKVKQEFLSEPDKVRKFFENSQLLDLAVNNKMIIDRFDHDNLYYRLCENTQVSKNGSLAPTGYVSKELVYDMKNNNTGNLGFYLKNFDKFVLTERCIRFADNDIKSEFKRSKMYDSFCVDENINNIMNSKNKYIQIINVSNDTIHYKYVSESEYGDYLTTDIFYDSMRAKINGDKAKNLDDTLFMCGLQ